ncbi:MAG: hypothetical protein RSA20_04160, partial [Oscillospiraceae bacterium]
MKIEKPNRVLCMLLSAVMVFVMLPTMSVTAEATEQFNLPIGGTYYFDLSSEAGTITNNASANMGIINPAVPDKTLHYVPFTYAGTVNAYSLHSRSADDNIAKTDSVTADNNTTNPNHAIGYKSDRSLFVADYVISNQISWDSLNTANLIFGKTFDSNYKLRSLSMGSGAVDVTNLSGSPITNEWDNILRKSGLTDPIKNWSNLLSSGQDTAPDYTTRVLRGGVSSAAFWRYTNSGYGLGECGFRPALEVLNPTSLGADGMKAITLNLNGGSFDSKTDSLNIVCAGNTFKAPSAAELTRPAGNTDTYFKWNTQANGHGTDYEVGATVPNTVTILYAQWTTPPPLPPATLGVVYDVVNSTGSGSQLEGSLNHVVTDPTAGITAGDKADGNNVSLKLTVAEKIAESTPDSEKIEGVKQGDSVQYYDVKVEKTVTTPDGTPTTTTLTSIPKPVQAIIPVPTAIQGKTSYTVYRVHGGVTEKIPNDPTATEFYSVNSDGTSLTLHVSNFSTYAVITGNKTLTGDHTFGDATNPKSSAVDVQGKVIESILGIYKLDISWGAMKFDYKGQDMVWNPDTHSYTPSGGTKGWTNESFEAGNNKITVANHSNGDVMLSYIAKPDAVLAGTTMTVRATNSLAGVLAENLPLAKVPSETGAAPTIDAFVWLTGDPTSVAGLNGKTYTKAGV